MIRAVSLAAVALAVLVAAGGARAADDELPKWPHEQQAMLRQVEDDVVDVQRKMFKARQQGDTAALGKLDKQLRELQDKRRKLINLTKDQLPAE